MERHGSCRSSGEAATAKTAYVNFDDNEHMAALFQGNLDIQRIVTALQIETNTMITPEDTLLIFDEVQEVPRALTSLKYFNENAPHTNAHFVRLVK